MIEIKYKLFNKLDDIPKPVKQFLFRSLVIFVIWKSLYLGFFAFQRTIDKPLTNLVGKHASLLLNILSNSNDFKAKELISVTQFEGQIQIAPVCRIERNGKRLMSIADGCNGLELFILYLGFVIAMPSTMKRKLLFSFMGVCIIHCINTLRCAGLSILVVYWKEYFDIAHHYIFKMLVYATIFILWIVFTEGLSIEKKIKHVV